MTAHRSHAVTIDLDHPSLPDILQKIQHVAASGQAISVVEHDREVARVLPSGSGVHAAKRSRARSHAGVVDRTAGVLRRFGPQHPASIEEEHAAAELAIAEEAVFRMR